MPKFTDLEEIKNTTPDQYQLLNYDPMLSIKAPMAVWWELTGNEIQTNADILEDLLGGQYVVEPEKVYGLKIIMNNIHIMTIMVSHQ